MVRLLILVLYCIQKVEEEETKEDIIEAGPSPEEGDSQRTEKTLNVGIAKKKV